MHMTEIIQRFCERSQFQLLLLASFRLGVFSVPHPHFQTANKGAVHNFFYNNTFMSRNLEKNNMCLFGLATELDIINHYLALFLEY
jgi:hypothetical protein